MKIDKDTLATAIEIALMLQRDAPASTPAQQDATLTPVLVTTANRGVFFGYTADGTGDVVVLHKCRNCLYWSAGVKGFIGLATTGPDKDCRVGPASTGIMRIRNVTSVAECGEQAVKAWEAAPWKS